MVVTVGVRQTRGLVAVAMAVALLILTLPATTDAKSKRQICLDAAAKVVGHKIRNPARYRIVLGTAKDDTFSPTSARDLICGFRGDDLVSGGALRRGDIFIGGVGTDVAAALQGGAFRGGSQPDGVGFFVQGRFFGERGNDVVALQTGGLYVGGRGNDRILGGPDSGFDDGFFRAGPGNDVVEEQSAGTYNGGPGTDSVLRYIGGTLRSVENCVPDGGVCPSGRRR